MPMVAWLNIVIAAIHGRWYSWRLPKYKVQLCTYVLGKPTTLWWSLIKSAQQNVVYRQTACPAPLLLLQPACIHTWPCDDWKQCSTTHWQHILYTAPHRCWNPFQLHTLLNFVVKHGKKLLALVVQWWWQTAYKHFTETIEFMVRKRRKERKNFFYFKRGVSVCMCAATQKFVTDWCMRSTCKW